MPDIKFQHIVSCSSEDPHHPATNLLNTGTFRKWRCAKAGEESATVIIQLEREVQIHGIDIGNNCSAFVEVLVGNSSSAPGTAYEVLLPISSFMSPKESKEGSTPNRVRMFLQSNMCPDIAKQKWDRVKVVCTQPYGRHMQYGLSFLVLHSPPESSPPLPPPPESSSSPAGKLGRFSLKEEQEDDIRPGSLFARRKEPLETPAKPKTAAAIIAAASSPSSLASMETTKAADIRPRKRSRSQERGAETKRRTNGDSKNSEGSPDRKFSRDNRKALERDTPPPESPSPPPSPTPSRPQLRRPFSQLMSDVTIVLSGFQNPLRGNLRQQAFEMGAKYAADWGPGCTHLICAFANTPKVRQVRGQGKLVKKEWLEHCHRERKRFPWRRYAIDRKDEDGSESEEEVWEETQPEKGATNKASTNQKAAPGGSTNQKAAPGSSTNQKAAATSSTNQKAAPGGSTNQKAAPGSSTNQKAAPGSSTNQKAAPGGSTNQKAAPYDGETDDDDVAVVETKKTSVSPPTIDLSGAYDAETDEDSDGPQLATLPTLPDFLSGSVFLLHEDLSEEDKKALRRYVTAYKGKVVEALDEDTNFLITESKEGLQELAEFYPTVTPVQPSWIWRCHDAGKMLPCKDFILHP